MEPQAIEPSSGSIDRGALVAAVPGLGRPPRRWVPKAELAARR